MLLQKLLGPVIVVGALALTGCGGEEPTPDHDAGPADTGRQDASQPDTGFDASVADTGVNDGGVSDAGEGPLRPSIISVTSGVGALSSASYRATIIVGGPTGQGRVSSQNYQLRLGPNMGP